MKPAGRDLLSSRGRAGVFGALILLACGRFSPAGEAAPAADPAPSSASVPALPLVALKSIGPVPAALRGSLPLAPFYQKCLLLGDFPVLSSGVVRDEALAEAAWIVSGMLAKRPDILKEMARRQGRLVVMGTAERTVDVPEHSDLKPADYWNRRARGLGASADCPVVSCAEENLLCSPGDPYSTENILVHEFAHAIHELGLQKLDPAFDGKLKAAYREALAKGLWKNTYAAENKGEYWAEISQSWFNTNRQNDSLHNHVDTRAELEAYDPTAAALCRSTYGDNPWTYVRPDQPGRLGKDHLASLDRATLVPFRWDEGKKQEKAGGSAKR